MANCVFNRDYLEQLLKHGVADKLSALFLDDSVSVREVATGAFRWDMWAWPVAVREVRCLTVHPSDSGT